MDPRHGAERQSTGGGQISPHFYVWGAVFLPLFSFLTLEGLGRWNTGLVSGYDLGIFSQSASSWADLKLPHSNIREADLLGDHFSPATALFGMAWQVWDDPRSLIVFQSLLLSSSVSAVIVMAYRRAGLAFAALLAAVAILNRGLLNAALFDVHEVAFAAPLLVLMCWALMERRFAPLVWGCLGIILVKEDLGATVIAAGACWALGSKGEAQRKELWRGLALVSLGVLGIAVAMAVIAHVNTGGGSEYVGHFGAKGLGDTLAGRLPGPLLALITCLGIGLRSPLLIMAVPTLLWRMLSNDEHYWSADWHYDLVPYFICLMAALDGYLRGGLRWPTRALVTGCSLASLVWGSDALDHRGVAVADWFHPHAQVQDRLLAAEEIKPGGAIAAPNWISPYLVNRADVYRLHSQQEGFFEYVVVSPYRPDQNPYAECVWRWATGSAQKEGFRSWSVGSVRVVEFPVPQQLPALECPKVPVGRDAN